MTPMWKQAARFRCEFFYAAFAASMNAFTFA
jgi:hypothetical protein